MMLSTRSERDSRALCVAQATGLTRPGSEAYIKQAAMGAKQGVWDGAVPVGNTLRWPDWHVCFPDDPARSGTYVHLAGFVSAANI